MLKKVILSFIVAYISFSPSFASLCGDLSEKKLSDKPSLEEGSHIHNEVQVEINKSPEEVTIWFDNLAPEKVIKGTSAVSGIKSTCMLSEKAWGGIGSRRFVYKESGSTFQEEVLENKPKKYFRYLMWDFSKDITHAIKYADGYFEVTEISPGKSILKWHVAFRPNGFIYKIPLMLYLRTSFVPFMKVSIEAIKQEVEGSSTN